MKKSTRHLSLRMKGEDVTLLQAQLRQLGYSLDDPEGTFGKATRQAVTDFQAQQGLKATGVVDARTAKQIAAALSASRLGVGPTPTPTPPVPVPVPPQFTVHGHVRDKYGNGLAGLKVRAFSSGMFGNKLLGQEATTDNTGSYEIKYSPTKGTVDLIVRVFDQDNTPLVSAPLISNAPSDETVDLTVIGRISKGSSEHEQRIQVLSPLLEGVPLGSLTPDQIAFLSGKTGLDSQEITSLNTAAQLAAQVNHPDDLPPDIFYALIRKGSPTDLPSLLAQSPQVQRAALVSALDDNLIPDRLRATLDQTMAALVQAIVDQAFNPPGTGGTSLADLLNTVIREPATQRNIRGAFLTLYVNHQGPIADFWNSLRANSIFKDQVDSLQLALQLGILTQNHLPLVQELQRIILGPVVGPKTSLRDLAKYSADDWSRLIDKSVNGKSIGLPPGVPGKDGAEQRDNYIKVMMLMLWDAFPTADMASRIAQDDTVPGKPDLLTFFSKNTNFEVNTSYLENYVVQNPGALDGITDQAGLKNQLKSIQRVFKLASSYAEMRVLLAAGLDSAHAITRVGQSVFVNKYGAALGAPRARAIYQNAAQATALALSLYGRFGSFNGIGMQVLPKYTSPNGSGVRAQTESTRPAVSIPDWEALFGSLDMCACEDCQSVYGPAAYLADVLHYLNDRKLIDQITTGADGNITSVTYQNKSAQDVLFERRPDLGQIDLNCENAFTPVPYVDLLNEVLENAVSPPAEPSDHGRQTSGTPEELEANPQYLNVHAYDFLRQQVYPWQLPFNLWLAEARTYLGQLGVQRAELMKTFQRRVAPLDPTAAEIAVESLGLTPEERKVITGAELDTPRQPYEFWGYSTVNAANWTDKDHVALVRSFLDRSGLSYDDLLELLKLRSINPDGRLVLNDPTSCNTETLIINNLAEQVLNRIHRFIRLWRKLGWTMRELDKAITALRPADLNDDFLQELAAIQELRADYHLGVVQILSWYAPIDTAAYDDPETVRSWYEQLFQNPAVVKLRAVDADPFQLNAARTELLHMGTLDGQIVPALSAAFQASGSDLSFLIDGGEAVAAVTAGQALNLENLSRLYRHITLAQALNLSIPDFLRIKAITGIEPFVNDKNVVTPAHLMDTLNFAGAVEKIRASGFSLDELDYLLRHQSIAASGIAPTEEGIALILDEIRRGLQKIASENTASGNAAPDGELVRLKSESLVKDRLSQALGLSVPIAASLLTHWVDALTLPAQKCIGDFLAPAFAESDATVELTEAAFPDQFGTFRRLHKIALLIAKFKITAPQLAWLFDYRSTVNPKRVSWVRDQDLEVLWPDLNALPLQASQIATPLYAGWERLLDLFQLRDQLPLGEATLAEIFSMARAAQTTPADLLQRLSRATGWSMEDLQSLTGADGLALAFPAGYRDEQGLVRLAAAFALLKRLGVKAEQAHAWAQPDWTADVAPGIARSIQQAVKAKYDDVPWLTIARTLRDQLRNQQRAALVSYLMGHPDTSKGQVWRDANDLYGYYLIDPDMDACMLTLRIKQAISSVQLFVQRCRMNLETEVVVNEQADPEWLNWKKWMKNYRVWEANRKVFLYPENWLEPELRADKSPFFKDLENELMQTDVTPETAEAAFLNYLEKLDEAARLEICGIYQQLETDPSIDVLHVFGRTTATPHIYYYRQRIDSSYWTAWEQVKLDIQGDHLIPVIWNRRLYLFWPIFTEETESQQLKMPEGGQLIEETPRHWKIQIAWSEYKNKKWAPKKISKESVQIPPATSPQSTALPEQRDFLFAVGFQSGNLNISIRLASEGNGNAYFTDWGQVFQFVDCQGKLDVKDAHGGSSGTLALLQGTHDEFMAFVENPLKPTPLSKNPEKDRPLELATSDSSTGPLHRTPTLAKTPPGTFRVSVQQFQRFDLGTPLFYADASRTYFITLEGSLKPIYDWPKANHVRPDMLDRIRDFYYAELTTASGSVAMSKGSAGVAPVETRLAPTDPANGTAVTMAAVPSTPYPQLPTQWVQPYRFRTFYHPYVCLFIHELNHAGIDGLLQRRIQTQPESFLTPPQAFDFATTYSPETAVQQPYPREEVDFSLGDPYALYNWELFFHAPLLIANRLRNNQRFEDAQKWYHYIFDPTKASGDSGPQRYWQTRPFFEAAAQNYQDQQIQNLLQMLASPDTDNAVKDELRKQVDAWRDQPFDPHPIARMRPTAYQKTVVMKYIDNLIAWGDQLFRQDTLEAINEATQLYILAAEILGRRPEVIKPRAAPQVETYNTLEQLPSLGEFSDPLVAIENLLPAPNQNGAAPLTSPVPLTIPEMLYFCVPRNDKLLGYWDTVADRLFKIRHCMNIEGLVRQLPLFEPPLEPGLLVRAAAAGVDIGSALNDTTAAVPHYRFNIMAQKASELCGDLKSLGAALLSALEKRDAEVLALLRSSQEIQVLNAVRAVKEAQVEEAQRTLEGLQKSRDMTQIRHEYYASREFMNAAEIISMSALSIAHVFESIGQQYTIAAAGVHLVPQIHVQALASGTESGGQQVGDSLSAFAEMFRFIASQFSFRANMATTIGSYQRRADEWKLQERLATKEMEQLDRQILAAEIRLDIANKELENHQQQIENAQAVDDFMHDKFTNRELYDWMVSQLSSIYFQSYQLAYDVAKRAERAYRFELGLEDSSFIQFGYWDSLKKGLLAGERLYADIKRMEVAYLDQNKREYELTKHLSLALLDPIALIKLKETGECFVDLPEVLFDSDYPGHYLRRIKSVSLTIPCVTGPYTSVNCTLTLVKNSVRKDVTTTGGYPRTGDGDGRFIDGLGLIESIATSSAQNDSGVFELNFRDERYLPFEGAGAISQWRIELPPETNAFDFNTISDVILHLRYTTRDGGQALKDAAKGTLPKAGVRLFSLKHEFPTEWYNFLNTADPATGDHVQGFALNQERFAFQVHAKTIKISQVHVFAIPKDRPIAPFAVFLTPAGAAPNETSDRIDLESDSTYGGILHKAKDYSSGQEKTAGVWSLKLKSSDFAAIGDSIDDIVLVCEYSTN